MEKGMKIGIEIRIATGQATIIGMGIRPKGNGNGNMICNCNENGKRQEIVNGSRKGNKKRSRNESSNKDGTEK